MEELEAKILLLYVQKRLSIASIARELSCSRDTCTSVIENTVHEIAKRKAVRDDVLPSIDLLMLIVSQCCNMKCSYCYANEGEYGGPATLMDRQTALRAVDFALQLGIERIMFFGGEPLLNFEVIRDVVDYVKKKPQKVVFGIVTNGTLISRKIADYMKANNIEVTVSLDGPAKVNDLCRTFKNGIGTHSHILEGIRMLNERQVPLAIEATYSNKYRINAKQVIESLIPYSKTLICGYVSGHHDSPYKDEMLTGKRLADFHRELVDAVIDSTLNGRVIKEFGVYGILQYLFSQPKHIRRLICDSLGARITVFPDGNIYPCYQTRKELFCIGNVWDPDLLSYFGKRRDDILSHFNLEKLKPYWFTNMISMCLIHLEEKKNEKMYVRQAKPISEGLQYLLFKLTQIDLNQLIEKWR